MRSKRHWTILFLMSLAIAGCSKTSPTSPTPSVNGSCAFTVGDAPSAPMGAEAGEFTVPVTTASGCAWTASSGSPFIAIAGPASGTGSGSVRFTVQPNSGVSRQGSVQVATRTLTVAQAGTVEQTCSFAVTPDASTVAPAGADLPVSVTARSGINCSWTATSQDAFIHVNGSGVDSGATVISVAANPGASARVGSATVAGQIVTVLQNGSASAACTFNISPRQASVGPEGGTLVVTVAKTGGATCPWISSSQSAFVSIVGAGTGTNAGSVTLSIAANGGGTARTGSATVAGLQVDITQGAPAVPCQFAIAPTDKSVPFAENGTNIQVSVPQGTACAWTAQSQAPWIRIATGAAGVGSGKVVLSIDRNEGGARTGSVVAAGQTFTVHQDAYVPCTYQVSPLSYAAPASQSSVTVHLTITSGSFCIWTAEPSELWVGFLTGTRIMTGYTGGDILVFVGPNTGGPRTATVNVAGYNVAINQAGGLPASTVVKVSLQSDPGDYVGEGQTITQTYSASQFQVAVDPGRRSIRFATLPGILPSGSITLEAPAGQSLGAGLFDHAQRAPFETPGQPGLDVSWNSNGCNRLSGRFAISELTTTPSGDISRLHASFEQHCEGRSPALRGSIWIDANGSASPPAPPALPTPATPTTFLAYTSDPNDVIGGGGTETLTLATTIFTPLEGQGTPKVSVGIRPISIVSNRQVSFQGGSGPTLQPGTYSASGVQLVGFGSCSSLTGTFTVTEASYGTQGDVYRFRATFELHCGTATPAFRGEVYIVADPWR